MIRVLVAEDSPTARALLVAVLRAEPDFEVIGEAMDGEAAVTMTKRLRPDVVTMDIHMPRADGFHATKQIMVEAPTPIVIVSQSVEASRVAVSMQGLRAGALAVVQTPPAPTSASFEEMRRELVSTVRAMAGVKVVRRWASSDPPPLAKAITEPAPRVPCRIVAIAASTGGPAAIYGILSDLPPPMTAPVVIVQHIGPGFAAGLAEWLATASARRVRIVTAREPLEPSTVYLPPDDRHLVLASAGQVETSSAPAVGGFRPSASTLFASVARAHGAASLGVILTGMGRDGVDGLVDIKRAGGRILAQDEATSVVFGMPRAAIAAGLADEILAVSMIPYRIAHLAGTPSRDHNGRKP